MYDLSFSVCYMLLIDIIFLLFWGVLLACPFVKMLFALQ